MNPVFDSAVVTDKRCLGDAPVIDERGRCTFPSCGRPADYHVRFDADEPVELIDPREYHRGTVGYYRDEVIGLARVTAEVLADITRTSPENPARMVVDGMGVQVAAAAFAAGYRLAA